MTTYTVPQLEALIARLPIDDTNYGLCLALLALPYDIFRPIMDLLFAGSIFFEDLTDTAAATAASPQQLADANAAGAIFQADSFDVSTAALQARLAAIIATGGRATSVVTPRDQSAVGISPGGAPSQAAVQGSSVDNSYDASVIAPNAIQLLRAGSVPAAQKLAARQFAAAMNKEVC